ncbi:MAG TPA: hypothetical protein VLI69_02485 [Gammaproteobacteria bacterium]|nr:hypothetical protein [Gammaproteobacteria bacterium]
MLREEKTPVSRGPIVVLDVYDTLILSHDETGETQQAFNHRLVFALKEAGITEVYLFAGLQLKIQPLQEMRKVEILRLELIRYLEQFGITVKAVVTNYDQLSPTPVPGSYYDQFIKPEEDYVLRNPTADLSNPECTYQIMLKHQNSLDTDLLSKMGQSKDYKKLLSDFLFDSFQKEGLVSADNPRTVLFLDDRRDSLSSVSERANHYGIPINCLQVTEKLTPENYLDFFSKHYPKVEYLRTVERSLESIDAAKGKVEKQLKGSKNKDGILGPVIDGLSKMRSAQNKSNLIDACAEMLDALQIQISQLEKIKKMLPKPEQGLVDVLLDELRIAFDNITKVFDKMKAAEYGLPRLREEKEPARLSSKPIVVLDVDETLIFGIRGEVGYNIFNDKLISALVNEGVTEVYLLTSYTLAIAPTRQMREEGIKEILRLELINHLEGKGIIVKELVSDYDLFLEGAGNYYKRARPIEQAVLDDPNLDLNDPQAGYLKLLDWQNENVRALGDIRAKNQNNVKGPLADIFFTFLEEQKIISPANPRTVLFLDDRPHNLEVVESAAKKHGISIKSLRVKRELDNQDYRNFLSDGWFGYSDTVKNSLVLLQQSREKAERELTGVSIGKKIGVLFGGSGESGNKALILGPLDRVLIVLDSVQKNLENPKHDWLTACEMMLQNLGQCIKELREAKLPPHRAETAKALVNDLNTVLGGVQKAYANLMAHHKAPVGEPPKPAPRPGE